MLLLLLALVAATAAGAAAAELTIAAGPAEKRAKGELHIAVYDGAGNWMLPDKAVAAIRLGKSLTDIGIALQGLPDGRYAVAAFVDVNGDGKLDTNILGIPEEPYGFSGSGVMFGQPGFDDAAVELGPAGARVEIGLE